MLEHVPSLSSSIFREPNIFYVLLDILTNCGQKSKKEMLVIITVKKNPSTARPSELLTAADSDPYDSL